MRLIVILAAAVCAAVAEAQVGTSTGLSNPNLATVADELAAIPELDAAKVSAIYAGRPFADARALAGALGSKFFLVAKRRQ